MIKKYVDGGNYFRPHAFLVEYLWIVNLTQRLS